METSTYSVDLTTLETVLQQRLQAELGEVAPLQVNCYVKQDTLYVVVEHPVPKLAHPSRAFRRITEVFRAEGIEQQYRGLIYLKVQGMSQPYGFHTYKPTPPPSQEEDLSAEKGGQLAPVQPPEQTAPPALPEAEREESEPDVEREESEPDVERDWAFVPDAFAGPDADHGPWVYGEKDPETSHSRFFLNQKIGLSLLLAGVVVAIIVGIVIFVKTFSVLTRPCVLRSCESLDVAEELATEAVETVEMPTTGRAILQAQEQLERAIALLEAIPQISGRYEEAQDLLANYQKDAEELDRLVEGLKSASKAANLSQNPPLPVEQWEESAENWQGAINQLETLPPESEFYRYARQKIREYRRNLRMIEQRKAQEEEAKTNLAGGQEAAKMAQVRQNIAQSLADLQLAYATWQTAVNRLEDIPPNTTAYEAAQEELEQYRPKLEDSLELKNREVFAQDAYNQALRMADLAAAAEKRNQWTEATQRWRDALNFLQQIPANTLYTAKIQPLMEEYSQALTQAQSRLQESLQVRQARQELEDVCSGSIRICVYSVTEQLLSVRLTPSYIEKVRQTARQAQSENNLEGQVDILDHVFALEQALIRVSDRTGIPLEIYTQDNILAKRHQP
ncbi:hypothetical protein PN462_03805 [Spirulina sp. CS-785/01]|uniref:hypothetical protein n=1 Tax=Spirulina sp. CS-785/01 TaxID=3021716 RepID=UPI00232D9E16|nr:hypothetical protein [Spirulina sp. CS-785/01]MDB9312216.1 hypothetical protein [Spirulina sp. CS-785/01]